MYTAVVEVSVKYMTIEGHCDVPSPESCLVGRKPDAHSRAVLKEVDL